ncbi:MAG: hypothetical protein V4578_03840, partial [Pseudomonadota bacterium]
MAGHAILASLPGKHRQRVGDHRTGQQLQYQQWDHAATPGEEPGDLVGDIHVLILLTTLPIGMTG